MKWQTEIGQLTMAVLRRTMREITPDECVAKLTTVLNNVYLQGKIDQITIDTERLKESVAK